jgi:hypothetical protein
MPLVGSLRDLSLPELLSIAALGRKTGLITIQADAGSGQIHLREGRIVLASDPFRDERFGEILLKRGVITAADLSIALESQEHSGRLLRLGRILIEMGKITVADQAEALLYQVAEATYDLCTWRVGYFQFDQHQTPDETGVALSIPAVLEEAQRRATTDERNRQEGLAESDGPLHERRALTPDRMELVRLSRAFRQRAEEFDPQRWPEGTAPEQEVLDIGDLEVSNPPPGESL